MSNSCVRNIKWLGILAAFASSIAACAAGDVVTGLGIIGAALSSAGILQPAAAQGTLPEVPFKDE